MSWTDETLATLRQLWAEGVSTAEIGRRINMSKNAVVGKAHRLHLPPRPNPVIRAYQTGVARQKPPTSPTIISRKQELAGLLFVKVSDLPLLPEMDEPQSDRRPFAERPSAVIPISRIRQNGPAVRIAVAPAKSFLCCWPIGEPRTAGFRFCDAPGIAGRPYCPAHTEKAVSRAPRRSERSADREML